MPAVNPKDVPAGPQKPSDSSLEKPANLTVAELKEAKRVLAEANVPAINFDKDDDLPVASVFAEKPPNPDPVLIPFEVALADANLLARYVEAHGRWQDWNIAGRRYDKDFNQIRTSTQERKLIPCECPVCTDTIKAMGWTF